jgi:Family of unknown function (DUF6325)
MTIGPVEYIVVGFPGNQFKGEIAPALAKLISNKVVRVLDLIFVAKDDDGELMVLEFDQLEEFGLPENMDGDSLGLLTDEDIEHAAAALEPGNSAALLVWEDLWAAEFVGAMREAGGVLLEGGRIPADLMEAALTEMAG